MASRAVRNNQAPIDAAIVGIIDNMEIDRGG
ncbi:EutN/CcmL family microcompartment protein [Cohnella sp. REN36]|nr:EutN/CcmL family microcompartment protein [Cohnella sp. REN36]